MFLVVHFEKLCRFSQNFVVAGDKLSIQVGHFEAAPQLGYILRVRLSVLCSSGQYICSCFCAQRFIYLQASMKLSSKNVETVQHRALHSAVLSWDYHNYARLCFGVYVAR